MAIIEGIFPRGNFLVNGKKLVPDEMSVTGIFINQKKKGTEGTVFNAVDMLQFFWT